VLGAGLLVAATLSLADPLLSMVRQPPARGAGLAPGEADTVDPGRLARRLTDLEAENGRLRARLEDLDRLARRLDALEEAGGWRLPQDHPRPDRVGFCGESIDLDQPELRSRFEAELQRFLVNRHWVVRWMRRSRDVFPFVEVRLAAAGLPDDLKYVAVIESALDPRATSPAGAAGYWQFMRSTGQRFGLTHSRNLDQRRDLARATDAALAYLDELHAEFGTWALALAAYNAGENRIRSAMEDQRQSDYHRLYLPRETEAYWYKAAAVKLLFEEPEVYGFVLPDDGWTPTACDTLVVDVGRRGLAIAELLEGTGLDYRRFKELNPSFRRPEMPAGEHRLAVPREHVAALSRRLPEARLRMGAPAATRPAR